MKRASNSPLTHFCSNNRPLVRVPRGYSRTSGQLLTPFHSSQERFAGQSSSLLSLPRPPRSSFRPRLGEGRVRSSQKPYGSDNRITVLLSCLAVVLVCSSAAAAENSTIVLKAEAQAQAPEVFLGDVADLRGPDQARLAQLARISLGPAPQAGLIRTFSSDEVRGLIHRAIGSDTDIILTGAPTVQVRLRCRPVTAEEIRPVVKAHVLQATSWLDNEIEIRSIGHLDGLEVPAGDVSFRIPSKVVFSHSHIQLLPLEVFLEGKSIQTAWITAEIGIKARVLQAARKIPFGKTLSSDDVAEVLTDIVDLRGSYVRKYEDVAGQVLRRTLSPGDPLTREALADPVLVHSGDTVRLHMRRGDINLAILARAEQNGRLGQTIRVRSLEYQHPLKAQVVAAGEVELQPDK